MFSLGALFGRGGPVPEWGRFLGTSGYRSFIARVREDLQRRELDLVVDEAAGVVHPGAADAPASALGLLNLAQVCHGRPRRDWPRIIAGHFDRTITIAAEADAVMDRLATDFDAARPLLKVRLHPSDYALSDHTLRREAMEGVIAVLVYDLPETVASVHPDHPDRWGVPIDELFAIGLENVRAGDGVEVGEIDLGGGARGTLVGGESFFAASHALLLHSYLSPEETWGALVAVPHRHAMIFHPIADASVLPALNAMIPLAEGLFEAGPGSISPHLYWWRDGRFTRLPTKLKGAQIEFTPPAEFIDVLNEVASRAPDPT